MSEFKFRAGLPRVDSPLLGVRGGRPTLSDVFTAIEGSDAPFIVTLQLADGRPFHATVKAASVRRPRSKGGPAFVLWFGTPSGSRLHRAWVLGTSPCLCVPGSAWFGRAADGSPLNLGLRFDSVGPLRGPSPLDVARKTRVLRRARQGAPYFSPEYVAVPYTASRVDLRLIRADRSGLNLRYFPHLCIEPTEI